VPALDARAALAAVESGAADAGVIYRTDAALSNKVRVVYEVPVGETPAISYAAAAIAPARHLDAARVTLSCFAAPEAMKIFEELGFIIAGGAGRAPGSGGSR
jgi:molybdate transport system substrate-binding protein